VVVVGLAVAVVTPVDVAPADHVYEVAPLAVIVAVAPLHIVGEVTVTVGRFVTFTVAMAVPEQPPVVPVTVYDVVAVGETVKGLVVAPVLHE
jgi:hypothetical protein